MTPEERKALAEQLNANPLLEGILNDMENSAIEVLIHEEHDRQGAQMRVRAVRTFRSDLAAALNTRPKKAAPA